MPRLRMIDTEVMARANRMREELRGLQHERARQIHRALVPYPLVMQTIVEEIARQQ
jgi:hypothetical protein